jgi:hypothetical protein
MMNQPTKSTEFKLGKFAGLGISATPTAVLGTVILWVIFSVIGLLILRMTLVNAIISGLAVAILHWIADVWHQLSHSWAAHSTGHPMTGIRFGFLGVFSTSIYPADEGDLPADVHIRRALGGPLGSLVMSVIAGIIFLIIHTGRNGGTVWWLALFFLLDNFLVLTLQVFLPLGFNDASTILHWLRKR